MSQKVFKEEELASEEQLMHSRKEGLQDALQINSMRAHGKILGMDTFSWINPQIDALTNALVSLPFEILWIGSHQQIKECINIQPELAHSIKTIIIHDNPVLNLQREFLNNIPTIICLEGTSHALELIKSIKAEKCALIYTTMGVNAKQNKKEFEQFISLF